MNVDIRQAELKDCKFITALSRQLGYETTNEKTEKRLRDILNNTDHCVFVAVDGEEIIGWIHGFYSLRLESDFFVEIGGMVIDERFRRMGVGTKLINEVLKWSVSKQCRKIRVRCNIIRKTTHEFYRSRGFKEIKEQKIFEKVIE